MYHIFLNEEAVAEFVLKLVTSPDFQNGTCALYADVPVRCFDWEEPYFPSRVNLANLDEDTASQTVDFVITRGEAAVLCITSEIMASKSCRLFETVLSPLTCLQLPSEDSASGQYPELYRQVQSLLESGEEEFSRGFTLTAVPVELPEQELKNRCFLNLKGNVGSYGRAYGLFFRCQAGADGTLVCEPVTSAATVQDFREASGWEGQPGSGEAIKELLEMPIEELFRDHEEQRARFRDIMEEISWLCSYPLFLPLNVLGGYPELVYRLRSCIREGSPENGPIIQLTDQLLRCIAEVLEDPQTGERCAALRMPVQQYFEEAAGYTGLYYPLWLYQQEVAPFLNLWQHSHTLPDLLRQRCSLPENAPFPDLMRLLVLPVCTPALLE